MKYPAFTLTNAKMTAFRALVLTSIGLAITALTGHANKLSTPADSAAPILVEDNNEDWTWTGMTAVSGPDFHQGSARAGGASTSGVYVFTGTGVSVYGIHADGIKIDGVSHPFGKMAVSLDGKQTAILDLSKTSDAADNRIFHVDGLPLGNHVLQMKVTEGWGAIDYIAIQKNDSSAQAEDDGGKDYHITTKHAPDKWLDAMPGALEDGLSIDICAAGRPDNAQTWHVVSLGNGKYRISPKRKPEMALTQATRRTMIDSALNTAASLFAYAGAPAQQWQLIPTSGGFYKIVSVFDQRCLNVGGGKFDSGSAVILYQSTGGDNEQWRFVPAG